MGGKCILFLENLSSLPETRVPNGHIKLVFSSGNSDLAKTQPLKIWAPRHYLRPES